jgi:TolB-like protein
MPPIDPSDVRAALDHVLRSHAFVNAGRLSRMLRFIVERTLAGEGDQLKEYLVGVEVFDRPTDYDPRLDSIVRVEARRLRAKLSEYYETEGAADAVRFRLLKGGYAPTFEHRPAESALPGEARQTAAVSRRRWGLWAGAAAAAVIAVVIAARVWPTSARVVAPEPVVTIAVLPLRVFTDREDDRRLADRLTDGITAELARNPSLGVAAYSNARRFQEGRPSLAEVGSDLGARVVLEGTVRAEGSAVTVEARLVDVSLGRKLWVEDFAEGPDRLDSLERQVAQGAAAFLLNHYRR